MAGLFNAFARFRTESPPDQRTGAAMICNRYVQQFSLPGQLRDTALVLGFRVYGLGLSSLGFSDLGRAGRFWSTTASTASQPCRLP